MSRVIISSLVFLILSTSSLAQKFATDCTPVPGATTGGSMLMNSLGGMAWREPSRIIRLDKTGKGLWEFAGEAGFVFGEFSIDEAGNIYVMATKGTNPITDFKFYKLANANGALAWTPKTFASPITITSYKVDAQSNIYLAGDQLNGTGGYDIYAVKYNAAGVLQWQKTFLENLTHPASEPNLVLTTSGQPVISGMNVITIDIFNYSYTHIVIKLDANGNQSWRNTINDSSYPNGSLYADNSGNVVFSIADGWNGELYKWNGTSGEDAAYAYLDIGDPVLAFSGTQTYVAGSFEGSEPTYAIVVLEADFSTTAFRTYDHSQFITHGTVASIVVDGSNMYVSGEFDGPEGFPFVRKYTNLVEDWSYNGAGWPINLSPEKYLFSGSNKCLAKIVPCEQTIIAYTKQPVSAQTCAGSDVSFTAEATGIGLSYYWHKDGQLLTNSTKYSGANTTTLTVKANSSIDAGNYYCLVKDGCGKTLNSQTAALSLKASPAISAHPVSLSQCSGTDAVFQITTTGGVNVKYQWKKGSTVLADSPLIIGSKTNKLTLKTVTATDGGEYFCEVTADCYSVAIPSQKANLNVNSVTTITKQPVNVSSCSGKTISFSVQATGATLTYQWKKGTTTLADGTAVSGSKTPTLTLSSLKTADAGDYTCVVSGTCGASAISTIGALTVTADQTITAHPQNKTVCAAQSTSFTVTTSGTGATYQWKKGNAILTNAGKYSGVTTATLTISNVAATEEGAYSCTVTTTCLTELVSNSAQLTLGATAAIASKSADLKLCEGGTAKFSIIVTGQPTSYQWKKGGVAINDTDRISGSKARELFITDLIGADAGSFTCEITAACGSRQESGIIKLEINQRISITTQPQSQIACEGAEVVVKVIAAGFSPTYQWKKGGVNLVDGASYSGSKTANLTIKDLTLGSEGSYACFVTGCDGVAASESVSITASPTPDLLLSETIDCTNPQPEWSSIVTDLRNTNGDYLLFAEGSTVPMDILDITKTGDYIIVKQSRICADTIAWQNDCLITGDGESILSSFSISPNPSSGLIRLAYYEQRIKTYEVYDIHGRGVLNGILTSNSAEHLIDMSMLAGGVYSIVVRDSFGKSRSRRFVIQH